MRNFDRIVTGLFYVYWIWRIGTFLYSSYTVSETITPQNAGAKIKSFLMICLMVTSTILHAMPLEESPRLSLASTIVSIPSQIHTIIFLHRYIEPTFDNFKMTVLLRIISLVSVLETIFMIYTDCIRLE